MVLMVGTQFTFLPLALTHLLLTLPFTPWGKIALATSWERPATHCSRVG